MCLILAYALLKNWKFVNSHILIYDPAFVCLRRAEQHIYTRSTYCFLLHAAAF